MRRAGLFIAALLLVSALPRSFAKFELLEDRFVLDGEQIQIISGSIHYFRVHPAYWEDRLARILALGLNSITVYVAWNVHEPYPGEYVWEGFGDLARFLELARDAGLLVVLRPGPYICAEWDFGGFPWWLASPDVRGGGTMSLRGRDPDFLSHVDRWFAQLFSRVRHLLHSNGGPIVLVQIENEYGFCGSDHDYVRALLAIARRHLEGGAGGGASVAPAALGDVGTSGLVAASREASGALVGGGGDPSSDPVVFFTTDPPNMAPNGTLAGREIYTAVDFGPAWFNPGWAFAVQRSLNEPGKSPPFCSEFYTGWLSHWGERMANTSAAVLTRTATQLLEYANNSGSLSFYMAHGGTNFGPWPGANLDGRTYMPHITSYDYDAPISEAGGYCQPGIGGDGCKFFAIREAIENHLRGTRDGATRSEAGRDDPTRSEAGRDGEPRSGRPRGPPREPRVKRPLPLPAVPPERATRAYGHVRLNFTASLLDLVPRLHPGAGIRSASPDPMESFGQSWGFVLYETVVTVDAPPRGAAEPSLGGRSRGHAEVEPTPTPTTLVLDLGAEPHDYAQVFVDGQLVGEISRGRGSSATLEYAYPGPGGGDGPAATRGRGDRAGRAGRAATATAGGDTWNLTLSILVHGLGRQNFGCGAGVGGYDTKGLQGTPVAVNGRPVRDWRVFLLTEEGGYWSRPRLHDEGGTVGPGAEARRATGLGAYALNRHGSRMAEAAVEHSAEVAGGGGGRSSNASPRAGPRVFVGHLSLPGNASEGTPPLATVRGGEGEAPPPPAPDTYLSLRSGGWSKGVAFINGFNLGWYWVSRGPQMTLFVPGAILNPDGPNLVALLEVDGDPASGGAVVEFVDAPDFFGPSGAALASPIPGDYGRPHGSGGPAGDRAPWAAAASLR